MVESKFALGCAALLFAAVGLASRTAGAYCRTSVCKGQTASVCTPSSPTDCGIPLYWSQPCVSFSMQKDASQEVSLDTATQILHEAFATWENADCGGGAHPRMKIFDFGPIACDKHEYNQDQGNANIIIFRDDGWPYTGANATLALTTVTYNLDTGEIYDADMELNSARTPFTTSDTEVEFDLLSITTHEAGHFLGLAHSQFADATMNPDYKQGSTTLRTLTQDDVDAICVTYPPGPVPSTCDATPRHGFKTDCATGATKSGGCCTVAPGAPAGNAAAALALVVGGALFGVRRRRARARRAS